MEQEGGIMAYRIAIQELGVTNDNAVMEGETPGDVWAQVRKHLHDKHKIDIPTLEDAGGEALFPVVPRFDNAAVAGQQGPVIAAQGRFGSKEGDEANLIVTRLIEKLRMGQQGSGSSDTVPPGGTQSLMP
jgi:hypothetical protein